MKQLLSIIAITVLSFSAAAQEKRTAKPIQPKEPVSQNKKEPVSQNKEFRGSHRHRPMMMEGINFSDAQKKQLRENRKEFRTKIEALKQNQDMTLREFNEKKDALDKEQRAKMQALLTPEQKTKMTELKAKREQEMTERSNRRLEEMKVKLSLSEDQVIKLRTANESVRKDLKAIRENESLNREEKHDKLKSIKEAAMEQRKAIFTPEQLKKLEEMKKDKMNKDEKQPIK